MHYVKCTNGYVYTRNTIFILYSLLIYMCVCVCAFLSMNSIEITNSLFIAYRNRKQMKHQERIQLHLKNMFMNKQFKEESNIYI